MKARRFDSATSWGELGRLGAGAVGCWRVGPASGSPRGGSVAGWAPRRRVADRWDQRLGDRVVGRRLGAGSLAGGPVLAVGAGSRLAGGPVLSVCAGSLAAGPVASFDPSFDPSPGLNLGWALQYPFFAFAYLQSFLF